ncbi:hypothetical protein LTR74_008180 [Friedmanniomyces endolithicus]|nr:hypothetical protein LTR74_008180 [Friedmanniomyces endolithicus]
MSKDAYEGLVRLLASQQVEIDALHRAPTGSAHDIRAMEQRLHDRGAEIKRLTDHVHELKTSLSERDEMISLRSHQIRGYRGAIDELTAELVCEHAARKKGAGTSRKRFNDGLDGAESRNKVDSGRLKNKTPWDEATASALRAQATTHLKLVKGLQADLVERDARIEQLNDAKLAFMHNMEERQETLILAHKKVVKERKDAEARVMDGKIALSNASIKMAEWKKMAEEQQGLIGRLMAAGQGG